MPLIRLLLKYLSLLIAFAGWLCGSCLISASELPKTALAFLDNHCLSCHDSVEVEGDLDMESLGFDLADPEVFETWVKIHDKADHEEMPPKKEPRPEAKDLEQFLKAISTPMIKNDQERVENEGRSMVRRLNRFEYENTLREILNAPWLQLADRLPEDGTAHLFNKVGNRLDVSHVQMAKYLETAEYAIRTATNTVLYPTQTEKFYAREEKVMQNYMPFRTGNKSATRSSTPLIGLEPQPDVIRGIDPVTVGEFDPELREREAFGFVSGTYTATTKYDFTKMDPPIDGRYKIRIKSYTYRAGNYGASGGDDHGLTGGDREWWRPNRTVAFPGNRTEPITLYALADSGDSRWLATYDAQPDPTVVEKVVDLKKGEGIRPDAARLVRTRPGWKGNPNATLDGIPAFALNWLEVEGPLHESWPPPSYKSLFADLPFEVSGKNVVRVISNHPDVDARRLLLDFMKRSYNRPLLNDREVDPFVTVYGNARDLGEDFTEAMILAFASVLCAPDFLYLENQAGELNDRELALRLSYFLWNGPPDKELLPQKKLNRNSTLEKQVNRLLNDERSNRFLYAFLDYWLDLKEINATTPDAELYPDYYLDDMLTESSIRETRLFFRELLDKDLPVRNLIDSDFSFINERLADHYGLPQFEGVEPRRVALPTDSVRGGLLTQASVMRVTANGTTTSPVLRGAWIMERILGVEIPPPPSGVGAIEPDTRGAVTIREQLDKHREIQSCNACHAKFDPVGFALESFDVAGGWQDAYRAVNEEGEPVLGFGKNGHLFVYHFAQPVDCAGQLADGRTFSDILDLKNILVDDERQVARNLVNRLIVYGTGAPVSFADRLEVEKILDKCEKNSFGMKSLIHGVVQSELFKIK
ncbi:MAG: DUF1592 domain-containing protein [Verrucomicrobia bacterium]|nr:DUF1592 domain-containing protein [Verrucomicrobiota bacterium]MDA1069396.1 DUF1592 domain-containing protein [Verrucomicrobiota bacterium]